MVLHDVPIYTVPPMPSTSICVAGMNFINPEGQPPTHTDDIRLRMLGHVVQNCRIRSIGDHNSEPSEIYRQCDIRCNRNTSRADSNGWFADASVSDIFILDYYWLPASYLVDSTDSHGYGAGWFKKNGNVMKMLGTSRKIGTQTKVVLLPNDKWGMLQDMYNANAALMQQEGVSMVLLTEEKARLFNPLVVATRLGYEESVWPELSSKDAHFYRFDHDHGRYYLKPQHPFIMLWSTADLHTKETALDYLRGKITAEHLGAI